MVVRMKGREVMGRAEGRSDGIAFFELVIVEAIGQCVGACEGRGGEGLGWTYGMVSRRKLLRLSDER